MDAHIRNDSHKVIKVLIRATYNLVQSYLQLVLESDDELKAIDTASTDAELINKVLHSKPDVILICLVENEGQNIEFLPDLFQVAPQSKVVVLSCPDSLLDQTAALKLGVSGIVGANQNARVLIRAIKQVFDGGVWLNQKMIAQLLRNNHNSDNGKSKRKGLYKNDDLTVRELEVIKMIALGMKNKDISTELLISEATVRHHLSSIYGKLDVDDRLNLAIYAFQQGLIQSQTAPM